jgi:tryptophan synthase alpha chain
MILGYGTQKFLETAKKAGVDGIIIPDLPVEEFQKYNDIFIKHDIDSIMLVSLTSSKERIKKIISNCRGFLYCISVKGVTGERKDIDPQFLKLLTDLRKLTEIPVCPGFGISNLNQVRELKNYCDGLIIGSKLSSIILESKSFQEGLVKLKIFTRDVNSILKTSKS